MLFKKEERRIILQWKLCRIKAKSTRKPVRISLGTGKAEKSRSCDGFIKHGIENRDDHIIYAFANRNIMDVLQEQPG